jgi:hypothetical protein
VEEVVLSLELVSKAADFACIFIGPNGKEGEISRAFRASIKLWKPNRLSLANGS